jgi:hypothetical protein
MTHYKTSPEKDRNTLRRKASNAVVREKYVIRRQTSLVAALLVLGASAGGQQATQTKQDNQGTQANSKQNQPPQPDPAPLFGGQLGVRSSKSTKESATLGFNGIDPSGKVEKRMLGASPRPQDIERVRAMDASHPTRTELAVFLKEGGLKTK